MPFILRPWQLMLILLAGWINREQQEVIEYLRTENAVLKELHGKKRLLLSDDQRRRLAAKGKILGRKQLEQFGTLFTPDTILRWHRQLVAMKSDYLLPAPLWSQNPSVSDRIVVATANDCYSVYSAQFSPPSQAAARLSLFVENLSYLASTPPLLMSASGKVATGRVEPKPCVFLSTTFGASMWRFGFLLPKDNVMISSPCSNAPPAPTAITPGR